MAANKYSATHLGSWEKDAHGNPSFLLHVTPAAATQGTMPCCHLGSRTLLLSCSPAGALAVHRKEAGGAPSPHPDSYSLLYFSFTNESGHSFVLPAETLRQNRNLAFRWGTHTLDLSGSAAVGETELRYTIRLTPSSIDDYFLAIIELDLASGPTLQGYLGIHSDTRLLLHSPQNQDMNSPFLRDGCAIVAAPETTDAPDFFLAGAAESTSQTHAGTVSLLQSVELSIEETCAHRAIFGYRHNCSVEFLRTSFDEISFEKLAQERAEVFGRLEASKSPELWMQEDSSWIQARFYDHFLPAAELYAGSPHPHTPTSVAGVQTSKRGTFPDPREGCITAAALSAIYPELALQELRHHTVFQQESGRLCTHSGIAPAQPDFDPSEDLCDTEIWFVLSWCLLIRQLEQYDLLLSPVDPKRGTHEDITLAAQLNRAVDWIFSAIGTGAHGLLRIGAGDALPILNRMGTDGRGESTVATAQVCVALELLMSCLRRSSAPATLDMDKLASRHKELLDSLGRTFDHKWFTRGYDDGGHAVGGMSTGCCFSDAQAWAVLAKAGTASERRKALDSTLKYCLGEHGLRALSNPFPIPPARVTSSHILPESTLNGGVYPPVAAWLAWALKEVGDNENAWSVWTRSSLRYQLHTLDTTPYAGRLSFAAAMAGCREWRPPPSDYLWQSFAMARLCQSD